ncbi:MAG TPA: TonB-dependent receptor, partial [Verrucomicrobiae bacterium]|nr:TonB-dependent receptor [Verrucomicrobiae bacterium]
VGGIGIRRSHDVLSQNAVISFDEASRDMSYMSLFVEDLARLAGDRVQLTFGAKIERAPFSGSAVEPSARLLWKATGKQSLWAAISRAVRTPSRAEIDVRFNTSVVPGGPAPPIEVSVFGNSTLDAESVVAYELGYRFAPTPRVTLDLATFYDKYADLSALEQGTPFLETTPAPVHVVLPLTFSNAMHGESYGAELAASFRATERWQLMGWYARNNVAIRPNDPTATVTPYTPSDTTPLTQYQLRSYLDLPGNFALDASVTHVDHLGVRSPGGPASAPTPPNFAPAYARFDVWLVWHHGQQFEAGFGAQDLLDGRHPEFAKSGWVNPTEVERIFSLRLTWRP